MESIRLKIWTIRKSCDACKYYWIFFSQHLYGDSTYYPMQELSRFSCHGIFVETLSQASSLHRFIMNQCNDQLLVDLLAQLIELCPSITEVMGSNPMEVFNFFRPYFHYCLSIVYYCKDCFHINFSLACWTPNIHSQSFSVNHAGNVFVQRSTLIFKESVDCCISGGISG